MSFPKNLHALARTSPIGGPFIGACWKCGKKGITPSQAQQEECPEMRTPNDILSALKDGNTAPPENEDGDS